MEGSTLGLCEIDPAPAPQTVSVLLVSMLTIRMHIISILTILRTPNRIRSHQIATDRANPHASGHGIGALAGHQGIIGA